MYRSVVEEDGSGGREADPSEVRRIMSKDGEAWGACEACVRV